MYKENEINQNISQYNYAEAPSDFKAGVLNKAYEKASRYHASEENRVVGYNLLKYSDRFNPSFIRSYNEKVTNFHQTNQGNPDEAKKISLVQEAMDHEAIGNYNWFGDSYRILKMAALDDMNNSTDMVVVNRELNNEGIIKAKTALAIDVTYSEDRYEDKLEHIVYLLQKYPELLKNDVFFDPETDTVGTKLIPQVVLYDSKSNLDIRMANWINDAHGPEAIENDKTQLNYLSQAFIQSVILSKVSKAPTPANVHHKKHYIKNSVLLKEVLIKKVNELKIIPDVEECIDALGSATRTRTQTIKEIVCPVQNFKQNTLHKIVWGF